MFQDYLAMTTRKVAIVGSKSLEGLEHVYRMIDEVIQSEYSASPFVLVNGSVEGVDQMALEVAISRGIDYEIIPLEKCTKGCKREYCFEHSYEPRSFKIAQESEKIYRIYDEFCGASTCEVTAGFGDKLGKQVIRMPVSLVVTS